MIKKNAVIIILWQKLFLYHIKKNKCTELYLSSVFSMVVRVYQESRNERSENIAKLFRCCQPCFIKPSGRPVRYTLPV